MLLRSCCISVMSVISLKNTESSNSTASVGCLRCAWVLLLRSVRRDLTKRVLNSEQARITHVEVSSTERSLLLLAREGQCEVMEPKWGTLCLTVVGVLESSMRTFHLLKRGMLKHCNKFKQMCSSGWVQKAMCSTDTNNRKQTKNTRKREKSCIHVCLLCTFKVFINCIFVQEGAVVNVFSKSWCSKWEWFLCLSLF